ncbi:MAG TPA: site-specific integrase, partial [Thermoleophilaceae bacterium]
MATIEQPLASRRFEHLLLDFLAYLEFERGLSRNTLEAYRSDLLQFGRFLDSRGLTAADAEAADVSDFLTELAAGRLSVAAGAADPLAAAPAAEAGVRVAGSLKPASPATVHRKAACLRSFYKHLRRDELIADDPTAVLVAPRRAKKLPQVLNYAEVQKLLASPRGDEPT